MKVIAENKYYEINIDTQKNRIYLKVFGIWKDKAEVDTYPEDLKTASSLLARGFTIVADLRKMIPPTKDEIEEIHNKAQTVLIQSGLDRSAEVVSSVITKMAAGRYANKTGLKKMVFNSIEDAEEWLDTM